MGEHSEGTPDGGLGPRVVLNDLVDLSADRRHPRKRFRPFASGVLPANYGINLLLGLLALASVIAVVMVPAILLLMLLK